MNETVLQGEALEEAMRSLDVGWAVLPGSGLVRVIPTHSFQNGFEILSELAKTIEDMHSEPEVTLRHSELEIALPNYEKGGVTSTDIVTAGRIDQLLAKG